MWNEIVKRKVEETDVRPNRKKNSKTHHEELIAPTPCAEESDAVVERFGRWNAATNSSEKKVIQTRHREWF